MQISWKGKSKSLNLIMKRFLFIISMAQVSFASHTPHKHITHTQSVVPEHLLPHTVIGPRNTTVRLPASWEPDYTERDAAQWTCTRCRCRWGKRISLLQEVTSVLGLKEDREKRWKSNPGWENITGKTIKNEIT